MSKGSKQRPTNKKKYDRNWDRVFMKLSAYCANCKQIVIVDRHRLCKHCLKPTKDES